MSYWSLHTNQLYKQLKEDIQQSSTIYILTSFMMKSGVDLIYGDLQNALKRGADIKVLTGDYLYVTQPKALEKLLALTGDQLEMRLWRSKGVAFHPKTYIFNYEQQGAIIVGSSNLSRSALTSGVEWNLRMSRHASQEVFNQAVHEYIKLFYDENTMSINNETLKRYKDDYDQFHIKHSNLMNTWTTQEEINLTLPSIEEEYPLTIKEQQSLYNEKIHPRQAQIEALQALEETLEEEYNKAVVVMATGLGKTYLAAFFAKHFKRVLFIAHREEIIKQAKASFEKVLQKSGGLLYGLEKDTNHDLLFASIFTLSIQDQLYQFSKDAFDLIIVDEFHHAAAKSYAKVISYFEPEFLLGLTATPERTDGQDVFAICEGNVAYEITFIEAIQRGWLAPFTYYGVKDDIDYSKIRWYGKRYDQQQLLIEQLNTERAEYIYRKWTEYKQTRTLAFCSSIEQAEFLAKYFKKQGHSVISLTSRTRHISREEAIRQLKNGEIEVIFTVDLFNEGVDIPAVDTLLFTRPTESMVVFTQQIGRGLRKSPGKAKCVIIDLIGNYRSADTKLQVFQRPERKQKSNEVIPVVPASCEINLETEVIDLLKALKKKRSPRKERIYHDYVSVKEELGRRPTYLEIHLYGQTNSKEYRQAFGGYYAFLNDFGELTNNEQRVFERYYKWLQKVEKEQMTKSYKMVVLKYMLEKGPDHWFETITPHDVAQYFHQFYMSKEYRKRIDFSNRNTKRLWTFNKDKVAQLIATMPMSKWVGDDGLITFENNQFQINFDIPHIDRKILYMMTEQICDYKLHVYFERKGHVAQL